MSAPNDPFSDELPPRLARDLSRAVGRSIDIPAEVDATILLAGRRHAAARRRFRYWRSSIAATAAGTILVAWLLWPSTQPSSSQLAMDLDHNGRVDILDAYHLARQLPTGDVKVDVNKDGFIDNRDVDAIADRSVALDGGARP